MAIVALIGAPASGKSKIGRRVAALLGAEVIDTDKVVVARHGSIAEIFEKFGEPVFRQYEREAVREALEQDAVVSLGGGAVLDKQTQHDLLRCPVVVLTVSEEAVTERIGDPKRPLLKDGIEAWKKLVTERKPIYDRFADISFDTSDRDLDLVARNIVDWLATFRKESQV